MESIGFAHISRKLHGRLCNSWNSRRSTRSEWWRGWWIHVGAYAGGQAYDAVVTGLGQTLLGNNGTISQPVQTLQGPPQSTPQSTPNSNFDTGNPFAKPGTLDLNKKPDIQPFNHTSASNNVSTDDNNYSDNDYNFSAVDVAIGLDMSDEEYISPWQTASAMANHEGSSVMSGIASMSMFGGVDFCKPLCSRKFWLATRVFSLKPVVNLRVSRHKSLQIAGIRANRRLPPKRAFINATRWTISNEFMAGSKRSTKY